MEYIKVSWFALLECSRVEYLKVSSFALLECTTLAFLLAAPFLVFSLQAQHTLSDTATLSTHQGMELMGAGSIKKVKKRAEHEKLTSVWDACIPNITVHLIIFVYVQNIPESQMCWTYFMCHSNTLNWILLNCLTTTYNISQFAGFIYHNIK